MCRWKTTTSQNRCASLACGSYVRVGGNFGSTSTRSHLPTCIGTSTLALCASPVWREARPGFSAADFLVGVLDRERERGHVPEWRLIQGRRFVCWQQDRAETGTRSHFYITAHEDRIVTCSFAHNLSLLDDELSGLELEGAMEDVDRVLESLTLS